MTRTTYLASSILAAVCLAGPADAKLGSARDTEVMFEASGPAGLRIVGKSASLELAEHDGTITLSIPLTTVDTGIALRNRHMREHLDAGRFPHAELVVARATVEPAGATKRNGETTATFRVHGKEHSVVLRFETERRTAGLLVDGSFRIDLRDYDVKAPSYLGVTVKPDVLVRGHFVVPEL